MRYKRANLEYRFGCSCGGQAEKIRFDNVFTENKDELYVCSDCGNLDYYEAFYGLNLVDNILYCLHCAIDTRQKLISFDSWSSIIETECQRCKKIIESDLSKKYCLGCKDYTHCYLYQECLHYV